MAEEGCVRRGGMDAQEEEKILQQPQSKRPEIGRILELLGNAVLLIAAVDSPSAASEKRRGIVTKTLLLLLLLQDFSSLTTVAMMRRLLDFAVASCGGQFFLRSQARTESSEGKG